MGISKSIELRHLRVFVAVAEELNFRAAAERLHLSQPPLSRAVAQFEALLGRSLFDRSRQGVALTAAGAALLPRARKLIGEFEKALSDLPAERRSRGNVRRVGIFFAVHPAAHANLRVALGGARVEVGRTHELTAAVRQGQLDAALVMLPAPTQGLVVQEIGRAEMHAAVPSAHPLARRRSVAVVDLDAFPTLLFVGRRQNAPLHAYLDQALRDRGLAAPRYSVPRDTYAGLAAIAAGQACTILCSWVGEFVEGGVTLRPLRKQDRLEVGIGWVTRAPDPAGGLMVARAMRAFLGDGDKRPGRP